MKNLVESQINLTDQTNIIRLISAIDALKRLQRTHNTVDQQSTTQVSRNVIANAISDWSAQLTVDLLAILENYGRKICIESIEFVSAINYLPRSFSVENKLAPELLKHHHKNCVELAKLGAYLDQKILHAFGLKATK